MWIVILLYSLLSLYTGYKLVSGRSDWLDTMAFPNILVKTILIIVVGYFCAAFYLLFLIFKFIFRR